jgi:glycosyltransferase involved in cell wall biosynthesis
MSNEPPVTSPDSHRDQHLVSDKQSSKSRKVLIITYYWPPSGGSGVQRWLKFVKYLPSLGWQPFVFTPENPTFEIRDDTLLKDVPPEAVVVRFPIWEPYNLFARLSKLSGRKPVRQVDQVAAGKKSMFQRITGWIRGNALIPDPRTFWVKPSASFLQNFIRSNGIQTLVTTGPPHSLHLIGLILKRRNPSLRWIVDLRDPWSEWDFLDTLSLTSWARKKHQSLERWVLQKADRVITIAPYHVSRFEALGGRKVDLVTNGFDEDDFKDIQRVRTSQFTIRHIGMVDELRDPRPFMMAAKQLLAEHSDWRGELKIEFIGSVNSSFREFVSRDPQLSSVTEFSNPMPHEELLKLYGETDLQLLVLAHTALAPGNLPGKFFEYLASGNFIFGVGPSDGDAAQILKETKAGQMVDRNDVGAMKSLLSERFDCWKKGIREGERNVSAFSRRLLTEKLEEILNEKNS